MKMYCLAIYTSQTSLKIIPGHQGLRFTMRFITLCHQRHPYTNFGHSLRILKCFIAVSRISVRFINTVEIAWYLTKDLNRTMGAQFSYAVVKIIHSG